jgi:AraC-like DNA-binding protein
VAHVPHAALRPFVTGMVGYRSEGLPVAVHRGLPSPYLTLVLTIGDPLGVLAHPDPVQAGGSYQALVGGLHVRPALVVRPERQAGVQLNLTPLGARALLGLPASALASVDVELADLLGPAATELTDRVRASATWPERFAVLERCLARLIRDDATPPPEVREAWRVTTACGGRIRVDDLARHVGWSPRHLTLRFRAETGLAPKEAARVVRFDRARRRLALRAVSGQPLDLAGLAAGGGWYDQAHLTRDWRAFSGLAPRRWLSQEIGFVQDGGMAAAAASLP